MDWKQPKPFVVFFVQDPYPGSGLKKTLIGRVGPASSLEEARAEIEKDKQAMGNTYGGLFSPFRGQNWRRYRVFRAEWTEVTEQLEVKAKPRKKVSVNDVFDNPTGWMK